MRLQARHSINLVTGTCVCAYAAQRWARCGDSDMAFASCLVFLTTLVYHGAHVLGFRRLAARVMRYDVSAVVAASVVLAMAHPVVIPYLALGSAMWLVTFHPLYSNVPLNLLLSAVHLLAGNVTRHVTNECAL